MDHQVERLLQGLPNLHQQPPHLHLHHQVVSIPQALVQLQIKQEQWEVSLRVVLWTR